MTTRAGDVRGIIWFDRDTYRDIRARLPDGAELPETFDEWLHGALQREQDLMAPRRAVVRVHLDPDKFVAFQDYCRRWGIIEDADARQRFASNVVVRDLKANLPDYRNPTFRFGSSRRKRR